MIMRVFKFFSFTVYLCFGSKWKEADCVVSAFVLRRVEKKVTSAEPKKTIICSSTEEDDDKYSLLHTIFSWKLKDALNEDLYKNKVLFTSYSKEKSLPKSHILM